MQILRSIGHVLKRPIYLMVGLLVAFLVFTASVILIPNWALVSQIIGSASFTVAEKLSTIGGLYLSIGTNFTVFSASVTILLSLLVGANIALFIYALKRRAGTGFGASGATSITGLVGGLFGVGCAACGSLLVTAVLPGFLGAGITALPFGGEELGLVGIILVGVSIYYIGRDIATPVGTCPV